MYQNGKNIYIIDHSVNCVEPIFAHLRTCKPLTNEQEYDLWQRMQQGSQRACDQLVEANMPYAMRIAKQYLPSKAALEDLFQAGCEGLVKAAHKFNASLGFRFVSFATWDVENEVRKAAYDYIRNNHMSLDKPVDEEEADGDTYLDRIAAPNSTSADSDLNYHDELNSLASRVDERLHGTGRLVIDLHQMLLDGYTTSDFARRHRLNEKQMDRLFTLLREETVHS